MRNWKKKRRNDAEKGEDESIESYGWKKEKKKEKEIKLCS